MMRRLRRVKKKLWFLVLSLTFIVVYCEFLIYYVTVAQCSWPKLSQDRSNVLRAFILADIHMLGPFRGHWADKWRREWQMHRAYQSIMALHKPDAVFILGDIFDEGDWTDDDQFNEYVSRFQSLFYVPSDVSMYIVAGNHDIGFHYNISPRSLERFVKKLGASSVKNVTIKGNHFILINSMAMHGDNCNICTSARKKIEEISGVLTCSEHGEFCEDFTKNINYSRPIIMQHFPLYRLSDEICTESDAPPPKEIKKRFRIRYDCLSKEATDYLIDKIKPRAVFGGHTHHGCRVEHSKDNIEFIEYSVPSFSWRNRVDPKYMLVSITPNMYAANKCGLPKESSIIASAIILLVIVILVFYRI